jgi:sec-independent protein translocase protein TatC
VVDDHELEGPDLHDGGPVKSFLEHLEDFRWVMVKSVVALFLAMLLCLFGVNYVIGIIKWPLKHAAMDYPVSVWNYFMGWRMPLKHDNLGYPGTNQVVVVSFGTNHVGNFRLTPEERQSFDLGTNRFVAVTVEPLTIGTNHVLGWRINDNPDVIANAPRMNIELVNLSPSGGFVVAFQAALYGGLVLASPFIFYFIASFVFPALKVREQKFLHHGMLFGVGLFLFGVSFCYFILMPVALAAAQMYSTWLGIGALQWRAEDYISFVCKFMVGMGLGFELPVVLLTLVKIGMLNYFSLSKARRYMIVINLVLGGVLTTPEPITRLVMFVPLQLLYEITVWIAWYWNRQEKKRAAGVSIMAV